MCAMKWKYPKTYHFPFSPGKGRDDKVCSDFNFLKGKDIIITEKMDGENITVYPNMTYHARSLDSSYHWSHDWLLKNIAEFSWKIPEDTRICGEYLYCTHSIFYDDLESYFLVFSIWKNDICLSWEDTIRICKELNLKTVPVLYEGKFDLDFIRNNVYNFKWREGFVVRPRDSFNLKDFSKAVLKYVRKDHVPVNSEHWKKIPKENCKINMLKTKVKGE